MLRASRAVYVQLASFAILIMALVLLAHFFPVVDLIIKLQHEVTGLGGWSALCYPLLFGACNILLLPGGILCVGAGFFSDCGGIFHRAVGKQHWCGSFVCSQSLAGTPILEPAPFK